MVSIWQLKQEITADDEQPVYKTELHPNYAHRNEPDFSKIDFVRKKTQTN